MQEGAEEIAQLLQSSPNLGPIVMPTYLRFRDFPGAQELADELKKVKEAQYPYLKATDQGEPSAEQLQAENQQLKQQLQGVGQQLQQAIEAIKTEQIKSQATLEKAQMDNAAKVQVAQINAQRDLQIKELQARLDQIMEVLKMGHDSEEKQADRKHEVALEAAKVAAKPPDLTWRGSNEMPLENPPGGKEV